MDIDMSQFRVLLDVVIATVLCGVVGFEREWKNKSAGLRTQMIVGGASCLIISISTTLVYYFQAYQIQDVSTDPIRVLQALVVGISFIGAGTILKGKNGVKGLTTAATLLYSLGIGLSVALEQYIIAVGITLLVLIINLLIRQLAKRFVKNKDKG